MGIVESPHGFIERGRYMKPAASSLWLPLQSRVILAPVDDELRPPALNDCLVAGWCRASGSTVGANVEALRRGPPRFVPRRDLG
jgi:hypothetical protein